jgi:glucose dehydrogenase
MDKKTFAIGILSVTGLLLLLINMLAPTTPVMADVIKDRDYQAVTAPMARGGDALYVIDNRTGKLGVFAYDNSRKSIASLDVQDVTSAFPNKP